MDSIISTFHIDWKIIVAQAINFVIVFVVLYLFALKPLNKLMAERAEKIKKGIDDAKMNSEILEKTRKESETILSKTRVESNKIFQDGKKDLEKLKAETMEEIKADTAEWQKNRIKQMEIDKKNLVESVKNEIITLAMQATEKLLASKKDLNNL